jgi:LysM repeat protein
MNKRASAPARALAAIAVAGGFVVVLVVLASALGGSGGAGGGHRGTHHAKQSTTKPAKKTPATYEIQSGDTLTSIAHETGVTVAKIQRLNPGVDPQLLGAGEVLKLK